MSVQNNLQKPTFTKSVMGYTPNEVDRYVEHVSERYNSVCRENAELKRRVLALTARLDEAEAKLDEAEKNSVTEKFLDKSALREVFAALEDEKARYVCFIDSLADRLNSMASENDPAEEKENYDDEWETVLESYIEEALPDDTEDAASADTADDAEPFAELSDERTKVPAPETDTAEEPKETLNEDSPAVSEVTAEETPETKKTPAEIAAELDFYTDDVHRDGESFDPMTLAAQITSQKRKPTIADFMNPLPTDNAADKIK